ncbi:TPA: DEAD/DEAH box helicase family protein [Serratia marcescens]|uniref:DEAD/DEAH box helicase family protein n=1 Tax=Serratia nevei TaxID=2703794 RepID=A0ABT7G5G0_9GAMM|nr:DEAD/DEAH box helicase family protein [Serratia nevei]HAU4290828.1 type III restriction endonuclease subunit R [Serratia marcescens]MDK5168998.1 DEAD/DEAH box helicase family protein [Serratia nevei]MDK5298492.1 DEAD/DEAH box helicase family protein [Serratia nevei]MEC5887256.1 DEAD/DEAH box helicase family protein [Serratia nevei]HAU4297518.1 type III restriction endonuclease subunit R [Serratia marcescens]
MEFKDYQDGVLTKLDSFLDELRTQKENAIEVEQLKLANPKLKIPIPDFCGDAWEQQKAKGLLPKIRENIPYSPRFDGVGRQVPNLTLKIPTGGGKTLLAAASVSKIYGRYLSSNTGLVLWIVPNEAIYSQTKRQLSNREHPFRQILDRASAGRTKILEKDDSLNKQDLDTHLCVMLLMLQSANRETKETLRLFRDRGNVHGFFPLEDDFQAHYSLLKAIPNLSCYNGQDGAQMGSIIHDSLGNVLRIIRPVVVIDEGHKAFSQKALDTVYGFNPSFVLELSATPKDKPKDTPPTYSNWLVDVRGADLAKEEMIKLPINLKVKAGDDWRDCLRESLEHLNKLQADSDKLLSNTATYIRPILLVQVERTGKDQREAGFIHSEDAKEFLLTAGLTEREIAIKTSEVNDLKTPENQDLLSPTNPIRVIITKQALQEGWDCPFAYVLCSLSASSNLSAMTQLVGRILRQPYALKTNVEALDQCYVFCHHASTKDVVAGIKDSLEKDGMADLVQEIRESDGSGKKNNAARKVARRKGFEKVQIYMPVVNVLDGESIRPLNYEHDILMDVDWSQIDIQPLINSIPENITLIKSQMTQITVSDGEDGEFFKTAKAKAIDEISLFDPVYATRIVSDIVPNPWIARGLIAEIIKGLQERGFDENKIGLLSSFILEELRKYLVAQRDNLAEEIFISKVSAESIQFRLRTDTHNWVMPEHMWTDLSENSEKLTRSNGDVVEKSLFAPAYKLEFNNDEQDFACYLDEHKALVWWHRNVAKSGQYFVQGWRKNKVYPDFIFAVNDKRVVVIETKGDQLDGNLDTKYKKKLLQTINDNFKVERVKKAGELELVFDDSTTVSCDMLLMSEWKTKVHDYLPK